ncbi:IS30 family transposase [Nesterenkonia alkaliphila]|uniref:IS30 family transposase n=2 Tax=Nesterenkonia alkaliphila TaxID=1463631 RepID=A0A7K1UH68_9MICC|nr:IS30 family transposase [Nesterenkonia alkaliphila]
MVRRMLTVTDRAEISTGLKAGWTVRRIAGHLDRCPSVISREIRRNSTKTRGYKMVTADCRAQRRRSRPQTPKIEADPVLRFRVLADLKHSRTPRQVAGRLHLEARDETVALMKGSVPAQGKTVSHEAIYRFIYALPKGELAAHGVRLRSKRTRRRAPKALGQRGAPIVGMVSIDERADLGERRVPGHWEGDLVIGAHGRSAAATLVERTTRFTTILALPAGKDSEHLADALIDNADELPVMMRKSLTWDQGSEMAKHAALTLATKMPVYFAHPHSPWERGTNENTNGLIREYLPKGTAIPAHQPYLTTIAEELNERPRAVLGYLTPREAFERLLTDTVATTA